VNTLTFNEWLEHWGEARLAEVIASSQNCYRRMWEERSNPGTLWSFPAWELCLGIYWQESLDEWHSRWEACGGRLSEGRMIAAKWDTIWERLSSTFYDGLGHPYPPYASSSCAYWRGIDQDEAIVTGAISESEFGDYMAQFPHEPLKDRDCSLIPRETLVAIRDGLDEEIYRLGGPRPGATRAERVAHERQRCAESLARMQAEYKQRNHDGDERNSVFRLLEQIEASLRDLPSVEDPRRWKWLRDALNTLTTTPYFERYPNWRARSWLAWADLRRQASDIPNELLCLEQALKFNDKLPIKRRIKKLRETT
jgi:hypothetical protein